MASHSDHPHPPATKRRSISLTSLIVVPLKQHLGCCVVVPILVKTIGSVGVLSSFAFLSPRFHFYLALVLAPLVVWLCLKAEDAFHNWQHRRGHFTHGKAHTHTAHCTRCEPCPVDHSRPGFWRRFALNLVLALVLVAVLESFHTHNY